MKAFLIYNNKITKYILPSRVDDSFLITLNGKNLKNCMISFVGRNNKWFLSSNGTVNVIENNQEINEIEIVPYNRYVLKYIGSDKLFEIYFLPLQESLFKLDFSNLNEFSVGRADTCNLRYDSDTLTNVEAMFKVVGEDWVISTVNDEAFKVYINNKSVALKTLRAGDNIFIGGLKIIWMKNNIYVNNPNNSLKVYGMSLAQDEIVDEEILPVSEEDRHKELYDKDDYFMHFPSIRNKVKEEDFTIEAPPGDQKDNQMPAILAMGSTIVMGGSAFMMGFNVYNNLSTGKPIVQVLPQLIMCGTMLIGSLLLPSISRAYQKKKKKEYQALRLEKYTEYLQNKERELQLTIKNDLQVLRNDYLDTDNCLLALDKENQNFWYRQYNDEEFLCIKVGTGKIESLVHVKAPERKFSLETDELLEETYKINDRYKYIDDAPIIVNLKTSNITSLITPEEDNLINSIMLQLLILHSSVDLKIVVLTNEENEEKFNYMKYVPHIFSDDKEIRFFASNDSEAKYVSNYLEEILKNRKEIVKDNKDGFIPMPYFLIVTDDYLKYKNIQIIDDLVNKYSDSNLGFSLFVIEDNIKHVPVSSKTFIQVGEKDGVILEKQTGLSSQRIFYLDKSSKVVDMDEVARKLLNIPVSAAEGASVLPTSISFMELFGVSKIEQLNIVNRWQASNPVVSLETVVGVHPNGDKFNLDLHEKYHGPHGLIAGSTGSGKSEFIITFILSLAINYHPYEVQFVLIDYKGGGLAGAFENKEMNIRIPHLVGTITNLDASSLNRSLMSIQSEVLRRQRIFNETKESLGEGTIDIYKYQKLYREGVVKKPMSHLFIISDEFAELKAQQPDFMDQLISISRIGRSLGVHLILATQKPSGVVNDQIWANSKFKVCLKVQDKSDSMDMLKRPEAASLKEAGRFYLQVGYDELFEIGQSGWSGAKYVPSDKIIVKVDESINFINNVGYVLKSAKDDSKDEVQQDLGDQLTNIVRYLNNLGKKEHIVTKRLWLDALPEIIYIGDLKQKYEYKPTSYYINPVIGEFDDPINQRQGLLNLDLSKKGNTLIYGVPGSGKSELITNIIRSSIVEHTPDEVNIYILDCGSEALKIFNNFPHVGNVLTTEDNEEINDLLKMLYNEIDYRKDLFAEYSGNYNDYIASSGSKLPLILVALNDYDVFKESFNDDKNDILQSLFRDGYKYGVVFVVSLAGYNSLTSRSTNYFNNKICLHLNDPSDYRYILNSPRELIPADYFGRGLTEVNGNFYEFQTGALALKQEQTNSLRELRELLNKSYTTRAKKIPSIPKRVYIDNFIDMLLDNGNIPIGYNIDNKKVNIYDFSKNNITTITYNNITEDNKMFISSIATLLSKNNNCMVMDLNDTFKSKITNAKLYNERYDDIFKTIKNNDDNDIYLIVTGVGKVNGKLDPLDYPLFESILKDINNYPYLHIILCDEANEFRNIRLETWFNNVNTNNYIFLGNGVTEQSVFTVPNIEFNVRKNNFPCMAYVVSNSKYILIKHVVDGDEKNE